MELNFLNINYCTRHIQLATTNFKYLDLPKIFSQNSKSLTQLTSLTLNIIKYQRVYITSLVVTISQHLNINSTQDILMESLVTSSCAEKQSSKLHYSFILPSPNHNMSLLPSLHFLWFCLSSYRIHAQTIRHLLI